MNVMRVRCFTPARISFTVLALSILLSIPLVAEARGDRGAVKWSVRVYPQNSSYIEVTLDPRAIPRQTVLTDVRCEVSFFSSRMVFLGKILYPFTKQSEEIDVEYAYRRFGPNPYGSARVAKGGYVYYTPLAYGVQYERPTWMPEQEEPEPEEDIEHVRTDTGLVHGTEDGSLRPGGGYTWVNPGDSSDLQVRLRPGLVEDEDGKIHPASGYRWVDADDRSDFRVSLIPGLTRTEDGKLRPARGYTWVDADDPNDLRVKLIPGLTRTEDGMLRPARGYTWVDADDPNDYRVRRL